ncbi:MAG: hypothetical protein AAFV92_11545, partial [Pseudomonadota bacterium]
MFQRLVYVSPSELLEKLRMLPEARSVKHQARIDVFDDPRQGWKRLFGHLQALETFVRVQFLSTGRATPKRQVETASLERDLGLAQGQLEASTRVLSRFHCDGETQIDLAVAACQAALEGADCEAADIDLMISAAAVAYQPIPTMAPLVMRETGIPDGHACAFDVNSTCLSFLTAVETAALRIAAGLNTRALVFSSEVASCALPWHAQPEVAALFGDGAAAIVLGRSERDETSEIAACLMRSYPSAWEACAIGAGGTRYNFETDQRAFSQNAQFSMDGKELFRITSRHFSGFLDELLDRAGWTRAEVDLVVPHQASPAGLDHL